MFQKKSFMRRSFFIIFCLFFSITVLSQEKKRIVFYNVENLFDIYPDSTRAYDEFNPKGKMQWTEKRYKDKIYKISHVLSDIAKDCQPILMGLSEVENQPVIQHIINTGLYHFGNYGVIHQKSPDIRGIDVALVYNKDYYAPVKEEFLYIPFPEDSTLFTRDILYSKGILKNKDTLHLFVCHFPSMYGGEKKSEWKRERAGSILRAKIDSLLSVVVNPVVIIMGDLNGKADSETQINVLKTHNSDSPYYRNNVLYNTGWYLLYEDYGSSKYQGKWQTLNHIIVSGNLLNGNKKTKINPRMNIFIKDYLLQKDKNGYTPFRTYTGPIYRGGYSDHLPIYIDIEL